MPNEFIKLLNNEKLREEIINYVRSTCSYAGTLFDNPGDDFPDAENEDDLWYSAWEAGKVYAEDKAITADNSFRKYFFDKISQPWPITPEELTETLYDMARSKEFAYTISDGAISHLYDVFLSYVDSHFFSFRRSLPFRICELKDESTFNTFLMGLLTGLSVADKTDEEKAEEISSKYNEYIENVEKINKLWEKSGISIVVKEGIKKRDSVEVVAVVEGIMSPASLGKVYYQISRCLPSIIRSFALLYPPEGRNFTNFDNPPTVGENFFKDCGALINNCLDLFFAEPTKKDSVDRRVRNAIHLLIESDNQTIDAIGLALSITAIEALLSQGSAEISEKLGVIAAALLEPDLSDRAKAKKFVKDLYDQRSRTLHGEKIEAELQASKNARHLAAAILVAILNLRYISPSIETEALPELRKLYEDPYQPGLPVGVPELNIRSLWADKKD